MPAPPTERERKLYVDANSRWLWISQLAAWCGVTYSLLRFADESVWLTPFAWWAAAGALYFAISMFANTSFRRFDLRRHDRDGAELRTAPALPSVDVFLPNCGESLEILDNTFRNVAALDYGGELHVWCLDDRGLLEVADLATKYGFEYLSRPNKGEFKKAGNLRYAFDRTTSDFIVIFDADFCPRPGFLYELLPYALGDEKIGIVQSPQYFNVDSRRNWLERGAGAVQEFFYRWVMPARDRNGSPICVGTNAVYRRAALDTTGGGALVENSEDVHTGFNLLMKGWTTRYVPVVLATGLCPATLGAYFNQQHRWCSGSMSLLFSKKFWTAPIRIRAKTTFLAGMTYYVYTGAAIIIAPLPALVMVWALPEHVRLINYLPLIPAIVHNLFVFPMWHRCRYRASAFRTKMIYAFAHLYAFADRVSGRPMRWTPTGNSSRLGPRIRHVRALVLGWPVAVFVIAATGCAVHMHGPFDVAFWPVLITTGVFAATALPMARVPLRAPADVALNVGPTRPERASLPDIRLESREADAVRTAH